MRENILDAEPSEQLRVYAVWLKGITGTYFAESDLGRLGFSGFVYDVYYVFGPDATWADAPAPLAASGGPVLDEGEELLAALRAQL